MINFNATLARFKQAFELINQDAKRHFNATLARFKRDQNRLCGSPKGYFNATLARFKQNPKDAFIKLKKKIFQCYLSTI